MIRDFTSLECDATKTRSLPLLGSVVEWKSNFVPLVHENCTSTHQSNAHSARAIIVAVRVSVVFPVEQILQVRLKTPPLSEGVIHVKVSVHLKKS
jgi:hypothetical protein